MYNQIIIEVCIRYILCKFCKRQNYYGMKERDRGINRFVDDVYLLRIIL